MSAPEAFPLLEVRGLERRYGGHTAISGVGFQLERGEVLALLGPNGAGKTTTLSIISGNLAPHAGSVRIAGRDLFAQPHAAKKALGYLPEHPPLYPELSVNEYLRYCARLRGLPRHALAAAVAEVCERSGLTGLGRRPIGHLSKGYQQRVGLAQALVHRPAVLVLDEPTVGLDPAQIHKLRELIRGLAAQAAIVVSTHLLPEASEIATRVAILHRGRIVHEARLGAEAGDQARFRLELARPPEPERLAALPGVATVEPAAEPGVFIIGAATGEDPRERVAHATIVEGWGLLALTPYRPSLEETFLALVAADEEAVA
ncbi:MAG: ABC transporter ATP-binding protein [Gammaproteobacteria bacterium]